MDTLEQRQDQRIGVFVEAKYRKEDSVYTPYCPGEIVDIHHLGCRLLGPVVCERGEVVSIQVDLLPEGAFDLEGVVAWSAPVVRDHVYETGVRFLTEDRTAEEMYLRLFHYCLINRRNAKVS